MSHVCAVCSAHDCNAATEVFTSLGYHRRKVAIQGESSFVKHFKTVSVY
jgi:hypothetical protein